MVFGLFGKSKEAVSASAAPDGAEEIRNPQSPESASAENAPPQTPEVISEEPPNRPLKRSRSLSQERDATNGQEGASKPPANPLELLKRIKTIPPKILRDYLVTRIPGAPPNELDALTTFFVDLVPPPKIHCVRCHQDYVEVENSDRSCHVPHDDESAVVEHVGNIKNKGSTYETLWGCCNRVVEGDGDQGPPDGWCYEGFHTTDIKRARFRADSSVNDDKLIPCARLRCFNAGSVDGTRGRSQRAAARKSLREESDEDYDERELVREAQALACDSDAGTSISVKKKSVIKNRKKTTDTPVKRKLEPKASSSALNSTPKLDTKGRGKVEDSMPKSVSNTSEVTELPTSMDRSTTEAGPVGDIDMDPPPVLEDQNLSKSSADTEQKQQQKKPRKPRKSAGPDGAKYIPPKDDGVLSDISMEDERPKRKKPRRRKSTAVNEDTKT